MRALPFWLLLCACVTTAPAPDRDEAVTTVVVVRHAEKGTEPKADPPLTAAGEQRATQLVEAISGLTFTAALSTDLTRTRSTAAPLAARFSLTLELTDPKASDVAEAVLQRHRGQTVLVVGHSNTVPNRRRARCAQAGAELRRRVRPVVRRHRAAHRRRDRR